jgi:predicted DNA-binding protein
LPILKAPPKQTKNESLQLRVSTEFKLKLQNYSEFLGATPSYVVIEALNRLFEKDRDFKTWLEQHTDTVDEPPTEATFVTEISKRP